MWERMRGLVPHKFGIRELVSRGLEIRGLVPFGERGQGEGTQARQMLSYVMEFSAAGGFHCTFPEDGSEYFAVNTLNADERFSALIWNSGSRLSERNMCQVKRFNPNGSLDILSFDMVRMSFGEGLSFRKEHIEFGVTTVLEEKAWKEILNSFLNSTLDEDSTRLAFEGIEEDDAEFIKSGQTVLKWVGDMDKSDRGLLMQG